ICVFPGPGPGAYMLPSCFGQKGPQYSFGQRIDRRKHEKVGPGPAAYRIDKVTRFGKSEGLQFSILDRSPLKKQMPIKFH
ncbi:hypothetical protein KR054_005816, partial [Drosophila jambulina]